jgi:hypothetical protein
MDAAQLALVTVPTSNGLGRYFQPSTLPGPEDLNASWHDLRSRYDSEYADLQKSKDKAATAKREQRAAEDYPRQAAQAKREGDKVPKDPRPAAADKVAEAEAGVEVQEQVMVDLTAEVEDWRQANADAILGIPLAQLDECSARGYRNVAELAETFDLFNAANRTLAWIEGKHKPPAPVGSKVVNDAERAVREVLTPPRVVHLRQAEMLKLRAGKDAQSVDGEALPFAETDKAVREGTVRLVIVHGLPRSVQDLRVQYG